MKNAILFPDIHTHTALFSRVHQFNLLPTRYIHASWVEELPCSLQIDLPALWQQDPRAEQHCAVLIIKTFCHGFVYDFSDALRRVALMPSTGLAKLMVYLGLAINARSIRQSISGPYIRILSRVFGPEAYEFATTRASLLADSHWFDLLKPRRTDRDVQPGDILTSGRRCLQICLQGSPDPLVRRLRLKFPHSMKWDFTPRNDHGVRTACRRLVQKIMKMEKGLSISLPFCGFN